MFLFYFSVKIVFKYKPWTKRDYNVGDLLSFQEDPPRQQNFAILAANLICLAIAMFNISYCFHFPCASSKDTF